MDLKTQFIADYLRQTLSVAELCYHYNISRKTGYKWIDRYLERGPPALSIALAVLIFVHMRPQPNSWS